ncbi:hypothetical protein B0H19DRAFT_1381303 [Mycena capillaripes]|nr:hypothetical protein B0H19DRAFT_1381303 [Mycena capillaripes]
MTSATEFSGDALHWSFQGSHVLFSFIQLDSFGGFVLGALFTAATCALERLLTFAFEQQWGPTSIRRSRATNACWRAGMYWVLASLRLAYMLIAMTMHAGLILIAVRSSKISSIASNDGSVGDDPRPRTIFHRASDAASGSRSRVRPSFFWASATTHMHKLRAFGGSPNVLLTRLRGCQRLPARRARKAKAQRDRACWARETRECGAETCAVPTRRRPRGLGFGFMIFSRNHTCIVAVI